MECATHARKHFALMRRRGERNAVVNIAISALTQSE